MASRHRIALVSPAGEPLLEQLRTLPERPQVSGHVDIYDDVDAIRRQQPQLLILAIEEPREAELGAARTLVSLVPGMVVLVICGKASEVSVRAACEEHGFLVLASPINETEFRAAVSECLEGPQIGRRDGYVEFAHGICDEINNPLMLTAGHLQLLLQSLEAEDASVTDLLPQVQAARSGIGRIERTMQKVRMLSRAAKQNGKVQEVRVADLARAARNQFAADRTPVQVVAAQRLRAASVRGDFDALAAALSCLGQAAHALDSGSQELLLKLDSGDGNCLQAGIHVHQVVLPEWELPRAFEPYYINRALRGTSHGLDLFLVRTVARAHGGDALCRRVGEGLEFLMRLGPLAPATSPAADSGG